MGMREDAEEDAKGERRGVGVGLEGTRMKGKVEDEEENMAGEHKKKKG